jgi:hypothetical protein
VGQQLLEDLAAGGKRLRASLSGLDLLALDRQSGAARTNLFLLPGGKRRARPVAVVIAAVPAAVTAPTAITAITAISRAAR